MRRPRAAVSWNCEAAEQGLAEAQYNLGVMSVHGSDEFFHRLGLGTTDMPHVETTSV